MHPAKWDSRFLVIKPAIGIFITCMLVYLLTYSGRQYSIDGIVMFQYAKAILFDVSFTMDPPVQWGIEFSTSKWPIGMTLAYIPWLFILSKTFFINDPSIQQIPYNTEAIYNLELLENRPYLYSAVLNPLFTATSAVILYYLSFNLGVNRKRAAAIALIYGLASPAAVYAKLDYAQPLAALFLLLAFYLLLQVKKHGASVAFGAGVSIGIVVFARPELAILSPILAGAIFLAKEEYSKNRSERNERLLNLGAFVLPLLTFLLLNLQFNALRFGSWFSTGYNPSAEFTANPNRILIALTGNLISPGRGILIFLPLSWFVVSGLRKISVDNPRFAWLITSTIAATLLLYSTWVDWGAGVSWGPRFFIPIMPYLVLSGFLGLDTLRPRLKSNFLYLAGFILLLGWVVAMQGLLFRFTDFYSSLNLRPGIFDQGDYNFLPYNSPILRGWDHLTRPGDYDIFWLGDRIIRLSDANMFFIPFLSLLALVFAIKSWIDFFRSPG
jgi:hypothetical protein